MQVKIFSELLSRKMTRKEFLLHLGLLFFALTGISALLKTLADPYLAAKGPTAKVHLASNQTGFGLGPYGG